MKVDLELFVGDCVVPASISSAVISVKLDSTQEITKPHSVPQSGRVTFNEALVLKKVG